MLVFSEQISLRVPFWFREIFSPIPPNLSSIHSLFICFKCSDLLLSKDCNINSLLMACKNLPAAQPAPPEPVPSRASAHSRRRRLRRHREAQGPPLTRPSLRGGEAWRRSLLWSGLSCGLSTHFRCFGKGQPFGTKRHLEAPVTRCMWVTDVQK